MLHRGILIAAAGVWAYATAALAQDADPAKVLKEAAAAAGAIEAVSYDSELRAEGALAKRASPSMRGRVIAQRGAGGGEPLLRIEGDSRTSAAARESRFSAAFDGKSAYRIDQHKKEFGRGAMPGAAELLDAPALLVMPDFLAPGAFADARQRPLRHEGVQDVNGVPCDVVRVGNDSDANLARWYIAQNDRIPRRLDRIYNLPRLKGVIVLALSNVNTAPKTSPDTFRLTPPAGFKSVEHRSRGTESMRQRVLLSMADPAPAWELKAPDGQTVSLSTLRGRVVVLNFFATWCAYSKQGLPLLQRVHDQYRDKPVSVFAISIWDSGDPVALFREKGYTVPLLLSGDKVADAFQVASTPVTYVIDAGGKVALALGEHHDDLDKQLSAAIDRLLTADKEPK